ncbi:hypothetical protein BDW22DRAFT_1481867 [Trametopsis cervina]|nr:hypothetical protein BDW22DRAFT_1481867 [Trametopsis cervina]
MKYDYHPISQSTSNRQEPLDFEDSQPVPQPPPRFFTRRRVIFGLLTTVALTALYLAAGELFDYADTLYSEDDPEFVHDFQTAYLPFAPVEHDGQLPDRKTYKLTPTQELPDDCRDAYFSFGALCYNPVIEPMDVVWTWVNGSDLLLQEAKLLAESRFSSDDPYRPKTSAAQSRQYRDNDELRHSMRAALENYRTYTRSFNLITTDFALPHDVLEANGSYDESWRLGQIPQWLDTTTYKWHDGDVPLNIIHHADIFNPYTTNSFNSYAIEAQFAQLPNITDHFVYLNDDFFIANPLSLRSFYTSVYGTVLRLDPGFLIPPEKPSPDEDRNEWRSMGESNFLLSERFGSRARPYVLHEAKSVSLSIVKELSVMWAEPFAAAVQHPFRETVSGSGDVSMLFLMSHFMVERWREALLWSWAVARNGGFNDQWTEQIMRGAWQQLGVGTDREIHVKSVIRQTLDDERVKAYFKASGHRKADSTWYQFSALDGYPYSFLDNDHRDLPSFRSTERPEDLPECSISYDQCFTDEGTVFTKASDVFTHISFKNPQCGDCIVQALAAASEPLGLESFLPSPYRSLPVVDPAAEVSDDDVPHLSLEPKWQDADFSLRAVITTPGANIREWTLKLLQRYRFELAYTPYAFVMLESLDNARGALEWVDSYTTAAMVCVNDDVPEGPAQSEVSDYFISWQEKRWSRPANWERKRPVS